MTDRKLVILAALNMMVAVAAGAFGAHGLRAHVEPSLLSVWNTAVLYHLVHALGLFVVAGCMARFGSHALKAAGWLMFVGIVLFSGSLYWLVLGGARMVGAITPLGGVAFMVAWALVALSAWRHR